MRRLRGGATVALAAVQLGSARSPRAPLLCEPPGPVGGAARTASVRGCQRFLDLPDRCPPATQQPEAEWDRGQSPPAPWLRGHTDRLPGQFLPKAGTASPGDHRATLDGLLLSCPCITHGAGGGGVGRLGAALSLGCPRLAEFIWDKSFFLLPASGSPCETIVRSRQSQSNLPRLHGPHIWAPSGRVAAIPKPLESTC